MMPRSVSGVFPMFQVESRNLTQLHPTGLLAFRRSVSGVSGLPRAQAYTHKLITFLNLFTINFLMREEKPNTLNTPDTLVLKQCFIRFFCVSGLCQVVSILCWVWFYRGVGR